VAEWIVGKGDLTRADRLGSLYPGLGIAFNRETGDQRLFTRLCDESVTERSRPMNVPFKGMFWLIGRPFGTLYNHGIAPNHPSCNPAIAAGSFHDHGVNVLFLDGRVQFVKDSIDPNVWYALGTRAGDENVSAEQIP
jgi:prepilin-type processing-associated H-X9-DG protein